MTGGRVFDDLPEHEQAAFWDLANRFLTRANELAAEEGHGRVAAAQLYAASRFNVFAMQAQGMAAGEVDEETLGYLTREFAKVLRDNLGQSLAREAGASEGGAPGAEMVSALAAFADEDDGGPHPFLALADRFMEIANVLTAEARIARISAVFMYAAARFISYSAQREGHVPGAPADDLVDRTTALYEELLRRHAGEELVAPRD